MRIAILLSFILSVFCSTNSLSNKEIHKMKAQYKIEYGKSPDLWPVIVGMKDDMTDIFSVPNENSVGTNCLNNAITLLRFDNDNIIYDEVKRDFIDGVGAGDKFYPRMFNGPWIGYTQTRGFLLFNLKDKKWIDAMPITSGDEYYTGVQTFDESNLQFVFQKLSEYWPDGIRHLQLLEFNMDGKFGILSEIVAGAHKTSYVEPWAIQNKTVFVYNNDSIKFSSYNMNFKKVIHPFCDLFNSLDNFKCLDQIVFHPTLPIAVLIERPQEYRGDYQVWLACWKNNDKDKRFVELLRQKISVFSEWSDIKGLYCSDFQFSPDGKWLVFRDESQNDKSPIFMAMPVDGNRQMPLGKPKILGRVMREYASPSSTAWITKPLSFVVSDGLVLYKWELDNLSREFIDK